TIAGRLSKLIVVSSCRPSRASSRGRSERRSLHQFLRCVPNMDVVSFPRPTSGDARNRSQKRWVKKCRTTDSLDSVSTPYETRTSSSHHHPAFGRPLPAGRGEGESSLLSARGGSPSPLCHWKYTSPSTAAVAASVRAAGSGTTAVEIEP